MNEAHKLTAENIQALLPTALTQDEKIVAAFAAICQVLAGRMDEIARVLLYPCIDQLPEELLDILAVDFKVDWYDPGYSLAEKRQTIKDSWSVHRMLGTPAAVVMAISAIYPDTQISEWWEYGGEPYHFRLQIDATYENVDPVKHARVLDRVNFYKNLRSVLDEVEYVNAGGTATEYTYAAFLGCEIEDGAAAVRY